MDTILSRHLPIITNRLEFFPQRIGPPPVITPRINFAKRLDNTTEEDSASSNNDMDDSDAMAPAMAPATADVGSEEREETGEDAEEFANFVDKKIPKPRGQPGHPGSGGYSLDFVLRKWGSTLITDVNKLVKQKADQLLETNSSFRLQNAADIDDICILVGNSYPIVRKYQNYWPVRDMLKLHLKYTSELSRKEASSKKKKGKEKERA